MVTRYPFNLPLTRLIRVWVKIRPSGDDVRGGFLHDFRSADFELLQEAVNLLLDAWLVSH